MGRGVSDRQIAQSLSLSRPTVAAYVQRPQAVGVSWPLPDGLTEAALERLLFPPRPAKGAIAHLVPDWATIHQELKRKGVTLLLWQEYKAATPAGFQYSWFCQAYRAWAAKLDLVMRQSHRAGEKLFVDYAGQTIPVVNRHSGEINEAAIFIAVLGASNCTYAEATWTQSLPDWIGAHVRTFETLGGVPEIVVPDNLKAAVNRAHRYEPELNRTYADLAHHYGVAVIPARAARPRDKAKVEVGVQVVERWILARLRHQTFFSLVEVNAAIRALLPTLNARPFKKLPGSRQRLFETLDYPALRPLPAQPYIYAEWKRARVSIDYHVEVEGHYYSVPYALVRQQLDIRVSANVVEIFHKGTRVASHQRSSLQGCHSTVAAHMPTAHRQYAEWTPQRLIQWVRDRYNVLITGPTGVGKTWLACALGHQACREGWTVLYLRLPRLLQELPMAKGDGRYVKLMSALAKTDVLILDDWGLAVLSDENRRDLLELLEDRHDCRATLVTSQLPVEHWHEALGDPTLADAILDRLVHNAYKIALKGDSMRKRQTKVTLPEVAG